MRHERGQRSGGFLRVSAHPSPPHLPASARIAKAGHCGATIALACARPALSLFSPASTHSPRTHSAISRQHNENRVKTYVIIKSLKLCLRGARIHPQNTRAPYCSYFKALRARPASIIYFMINRRVFRCGSRYRLPVLPLRLYLGLAPPPPAHPLARLYLWRVSFDLCVSLCFGALPRLLGFGVPALLARALCRPDRARRCSLSVGPPSAHPPTPTQFCRLGASAKVIHSALIRRAGAPFGPLPLAPLPLRARAPLRFSSGSPTRSALRSKKGAVILSADFAGVYALPLVAPLGVSLYWHFFCIIDHSALGARCRSLFGRGRCRSRQVKREFHGNGKHP